MSITRIKKGQIIDYMLEQILTSKNLINKVSENFNLSKTTIYRYLRELEEKGVIKKKNRGKYELVKKSYNFIYNNDSNGFGTEFRNTTFFRCKDGEVRVSCGCFFGTIEEFREQVKATREGKIAQEYLKIADLMEYHFSGE